MTSHLARLDQRRQDLLAQLAGRWQQLPVVTRGAIYVAFIVVLYLLPVLEPPLLTTPGTNFARVLAHPVATYVLVAVGLNVVVGYAGLLDLGYVAFFAIGAYTVGLFGSLHGDLPWLATLPIGLAIALVAGVVLGAPTLRLRGDYLAIVTLGFGEIIRITANNSDWLGAAAGIRGLPSPPDIGPLEFGVLNAKPYYWLALTLILIVVFFVRRLERSRVGRAWTAIREDEDAAALMGVPTFRFKLWAFAIGAAIGALSGALFGSTNGFVNPATFPLTLSILFLAAVVLGGSGNLPGVILGAVVIAYLPERFRGFAERRVLVFGLALVVMMIFRPQGLLPSRRRTAELGDAEFHREASIALAGADIAEAFDPTDENEPRR